MALKKLFNWEPITDAAADEEIQAPFDRIAVGNVLLVESPVSNKPKGLAEGCEIPGIPVQEADGVRIRSGSSKDKIKLPLLQTKTGGKFKKLIIQLTDGQILAFEADSDDCDSKTRKITIDSAGFFSISEDIDRPIFFSDDMEAVESIDSVDFIVGGVTTVLCDDGTEYVVLKRVPVNELCRYCDEDYYVDPLA